MKPKHKIKRRKKCLKQNLVFVVDKKERPLMPCSPRIARLLLNQGKARIYKHAYTGFFSIKLNYVPKKHYLQKNRIGVDTGSKNIGVAVVRIDKNQGKVSRSCTHLYEVRMRGDEITKNLERRRMYRRNRRNRKTRYRKCRFLNRKNSRREGLRSPTMKHKFDTHCRIIDTLQSLLPRHSLVLEIGNFDPQLMKNEDKPFNRYWGYQKGVNYGFANRKAYVLWRDKYKCQKCRKSNVPLEVHHIIYRSNGGSDNEDNLIALCCDCHKKVHKGEIKLRKCGVRKYLKNATQMNFIKCLLMEHYPKANTTLGFITKENRQHLRLQKEHFNDALVIASKGKKVKIENNKVTKIRRISKGYYKLTEGKRSEFKRPALNEGGFKNFDKIKYFGYIGFVREKAKDIHKDGSLVVRCYISDIEGNRVVLKNKIPKMAKEGNFSKINSRRTFIHFIQGN